MKGCCPTCERPLPGDGVIFHVESRSVVVDGTSYRIKTLSESELMQVLVRYFGRVKSRESIYIALYGHMIESDKANEKIVDIFICKLRKQLKAMNCPLEIVTYWAQGWQLRRRQNVQLHSESIQSQGPSGKGGAVSASPPVHG